MKKLMAFVLLSALFAAASCSSNNNNNSDDNHNNNSDDNEAVEEPTVVVSLDELDGKWYTLSPLFDSIWTDYSELNIHASDYTYGGSNGCNHFSGNFSYSKGKITFEHAVGTMMWCPCEGGFGIPGYDEPLSIDTVTYHDCPGFLIGNKPFTVMLLREGKWMLSGDWDVLEANGASFEGYSLSMSVDLESNLAVVSDDEHAAELALAIGEDSEVSISPSGSAKGRGRIINDLIRALRTVTHYKPLCRNDGGSVGVGLQDSTGNIVIILQRDSPCVKQEYGKADEKNVGV